MMRFVAAGLVLALLGAASPATVAGPTVGLENEPITHLGPKLLGDSALVIVGSLAGDSLRVVVSWAHPTDGLGVEDSTAFNIKATKVIRFSGGGTVAANTYRHRKFTSAITADTFRLLKPAVGDSVIFQADSIRQCRQGACSVPGSAGWGYHRSAAPPAMTFIKVSVDSF